MLYSFQINFMQSTDTLNPTKINSKLLIQQYKNTRQASELLCKPLKVEDYVVQPAEFISPPKWNLAHVTWFFETFILKQHLPSYQEHNPQFAYFFNSYYESLGNRTFRAHRGNMTRPTTEEVYTYRSYVDKYMVEFLKTTELTDEQVALVELGINHEQQHQELLLTDIKFILGHNPLFPIYDLGKEEHLNTDQENQEMLKGEGGIYEIGYKGEGFCFDNELNKHKVYINEFNSKTLIFV
jgi:ergothioneine biosynthesis protein EgtB